MKTVFDKFKLDGKVAIITGGAGLLGNQYAKTLCEAGATVLLFDINKKNLDKVTSELKEKEYNCEGFEIDISKKENLEKTINSIIEKYGKIDILVNNAATKSESFFSEFEDFPLDDWNRVMDVNLTALFLCSQLVGKQMLKEGRGVIVNISSIYGIVGPDERLYENSKIRTPPVYAASKGGVINLTRYLASHWRNKNIRVNTMTLGGVYDNHKEDFVERYGSRNLIGRMANKDEYNAALLFLVSDASTYVTGTNLIIDGGWTAW